jgi:hypothetical protein
VIRRRTNLETATETNIPQRNVSQDNSLKQRAFSSLHNAREATKWDSATGNLLWHRFLLQGGSITHGNDIIFVIRKKIIVHEMQNGTRYLAPEFLVDVFFRRPLLHGNEYGWNKQTSTIQAFGLNDLINNKTFFFMGVVGTDESRNSCLFFLEMFCGSR